jgi:cyclopropane fatty-acyl-phospholipid synthase-like methyltransferase
MHGQSIALPEELYDKMRMRPEFLKTYIFPGGCLPSLGRIVSAMSNASRLKYEQNHPCMHAFSTFCIDVSTLTPVQHSAP